MRTIHKIRQTAIIALICGLSFQCASPKLVATTSFEEKVPFKIKSVYFQEWFTGIDYGGTGYTLYLPVVQKNPNITVEEVFFRNLKGRFHLQDGRYIAVMKNPTKGYVFRKPEKPEDYPFDLNDNECVVTYSEDGVTKYHKLGMDKEMAGAYYENGAPSIYTRPDRSTLATLDEEDN